MRYINYNGNIFSEQEALIPVTNRAFRYGDAFFETMAMFDKKIPLLDYHWSRIDFTTQVLSGVLPVGFSMESLQSMILDLASVNDGVKNARVRLQLFRKGDALYLPDNDELGYCITMDVLENTKFECGDGLSAGIREDCYKPVSMISDIKNSSALAYVMAAQFAKIENWDEIILLNHYNQVCESLYSNIILFKEDKLVTPDLDSGCMNGVMRCYLMGTLENQIEERDVEAKELLEADEILLTNAVKGIQWIKTFQDRTYKNNKAIELTALLNENLLGTPSS